MAVLGDKDLGLFDATELRALTALAPLPTGMQKASDRTLRYCVFLLRVAELGEETSLACLLCLCLLLLVVQTDLFK